MTTSVVLHLLGSMLVLLLVRLGGGSEDPLFQAIKPNTGLSLNTSNKAVYQKNTGKA